MAITQRDAIAIHEEAQAAGVDDETLEDWTEEVGGYRYAITHHTGAIKVRYAHEVRTRIKAYAARAAALASGTEPVPAGALLATPPQVDYILNLLEQRQQSGHGGGFIMDGPTDRAEIERMTRREASSYITSLKEDY